MNSADEFSEYENSIVLTPTGVMRDQLLGGTKKIWWLFFWVDCLPVWGQVTLLLLRSARTFGMAFPSKREAILCLTIGPSVIVTETPMSCVPPHLLQETETP